MDILTHCRDRSSASRARTRTSSARFEVLAFQVSPEIDGIYERTFFRKFGTSFAPALLCSGHLKKGQS
jgi:hypothetical protein